jgi:hypothetical protein
MSIFQQGSPWTTPGRVYSKKSKKANPTREAWDFPLCALSLHDAIRQWYFSSHTHMIPVFGVEHLDDQRDWCAQYAQGAWAELPTRIKDEDFREELSHRVRAGDLGPSQTRIAISVDKLKMAAGTRRLSAAWGVEYEPVESYHGLDVESELATALAMEIQKEIDTEILQGLSSIAPNGLAKQAINRHKPVWWFAFVDARDATLFKLTWGGE